MLHSEVGKGNLGYANWELFFAILKLLNKFDQNSNLILNKDDNIS